MARGGNITIYHNHPFHVQLQYLSFVNHASSITRSMPDTLTLRIDLLYVRPPVTRTFMVSSDISMYELHFIIQTVMGWSNEHLYRFDVGGSYPVKPPRRYIPKADGQRSIADERLVFDDDDGDRVTDAHDVTVGEAFTDVIGTKVKYEYDFGDEWIHHLELLDRSDSSEEDEEELPLVISGQNACPPEDCGGPPGYGGLRMVLNDPTHSEYQRRKEWMRMIGHSNFDPKKYSVDEINIELRKLKEHIREFEVNMESAP